MNTASATAPASTPAATTPPPTKRLFRLVPWIVLAITIFLVVLVFTQWDAHEANADVQSTDNASVQGETTVLTARATGYVRHVNFTDFQQVKAGDVMVQLEDDDYRATVASARADLDRALANLANLANEEASQQATIAQAVAAEQTSAARLSLARQENARFQALSGSGAVTGQEADNARSALDAAVATQVGNGAATDLQRRQLDVLRGRRAERQAAVAAAVAALRSAEINLSHTRILAPSDGVAGARNVQVGALLSPGAKVANFVPSSRPYVIANYKETQLARVRVGQLVTITVDGFPGQTLKGRVARISPAGGNVFSVVPADNATGNFTKVVQRIAVRIDIAENQPLSTRVRPGMSVETRIDTSAAR
jgi:membrane fusion protein (multidrug efflux system)